MSAGIPGAGLRKAQLGNRVTKSTGTLSAASIPLFTISTGVVLLTSLVGRVTTAVTVANSSKIQFNPTLGTTVDLCGALDIGTTDTVVGELLSLSLVKADAMFLGAAALKGPGVPLSVGQIEQVSAGTDGVILWTATWIPLEDGASLVAA